MSPAVVAPATRSPNYWRTPNQPGSSAQESQTEMARQYLGLLWEGLMVGLRLGLPRCPGPPRPSGEQPRRRRRLCSSIPMLQRAIWTAVNRTTSGFFYPIEEAELGPVAGKRVLHLQCHFRFRHPEIRSTRRQCRRLGFFRGCDRRCPAIGR